MGKSVGDVAVAYHGEKSSSFSRNFWRRLCQDKLALIGGCILLLFLLAGIFAPLLAPHDPVLVDVKIRLQEPSLEYPLGTDNMGQCILSRLIFGARTTLTTSLLVLAGILADGIPLGLLAGYCGGWVDNFIMRAADIVCTFPSSLLALAIVSIFGSSLWNVMLALVSLWWAPFARILRGTVMKTKEQDFVLAAQASGTSRWRIVTRHILLNSISPIVVYSTLRVAAIIMHVAGFSFIGLGTQAPDADWGVMLNDARQFISTAPLQMVWPGLAIMLVVFSLNMFGEGLNAALLPSSGKKSKDWGNH